MNIYLHVWNKPGLGAYIRLWTYLLCKLYGINVFEKQVQLLKINVKAMKKGSIICLNEVIY